MYYYDDYNLDYNTLSNDHYEYDLVEMCEYHMMRTHNHYNDVQDMYEIDDEYARDTCDYNELAYRHYA